jgi:hypothetical protein
MVELGQLNDAHAFCVLDLPAEGAYVAMELIRDAYDVLGIRAALPVPHQAVIGHRRPLREAAARQVAPRLRE